MATSPVPAAALAGDIELIEGFVTRDGVGTTGGVGDVGEMDDVPHAAELSTRTPKIVRLFICRLYLVASSRRLRWVPVATANRDGAKIGLSPRFGQDNDGYTRTA